MLLNENHEINYSRCTLYYTTSKGEFEQKSIFEERLIRNYDNESIN